MNYDMNFKDMTPIYPVRELSVKNIFRNIYLRELAISARHICITLFPLWDLKSTHIFTFDIVGL